MSLNSLHVGFATSIKDLIETHQIMLTVTDTPRNNETRRFLQRLVDLLDDYIFRDCDPNHFTVEDEEYTGSDEGWAERKARSIAGEVGLETLDAKAVVQKHQSYAGKDGVIYDSDIAAIEQDLKDRAARIAAEKAVAKAKLAKPVEGAVKPSGEANDHTLKVKMTATRKRLEKTLTDLKTTGSKTQSAVSYINAVYRRLRKHPERYFVESGEGASWKDQWTRLQRLCQAKCFDFPDVPKSLSELKAMVDFMNKELSVSPSKQ
jgi:hypothetical protein